MVNEGSQSVVADEYRSKSTDLGPNMVEVPIEHLKSKPFPPNSHSEKPSDPER